MQLYYAILYFLKKNVFPSVPTYVNKANTTIAMRTGFGTLAVKSPMARPQNVPGQVTSMTSTKCSSLSVHHNK